MAAFGATLAIATRNTREWAFSAALIYSRAHFVISEHYEVIRIEIPHVQGTRVSSIAHHSDFFIKMSLKSPTVRS